MQRCLETRPGKINLPWFVFYPLYTWGGMFKEMLSLGTKDEDIHLIIYSYSILDSIYPESLM